MPLSKPQPRKHLHTRQIQCRGYEREDGLWDIEGEIVDTKTYSFDNVDRGGVAAGEAVHHMVVRLSLDDDLVVRKAEGVTKAAPYAICGDITGDLKTLEGASITPGWRKEVIKRLGGVKGCTHITDLLVGPMAVTAHQTMATARQKRQALGADGGPPRQLNSCHAYAQGSAVVKRLWPDFYQET
ncbi:MAG: DUF2889 domain-containing protein [Proteobacteria bacterium]|nr:DUF2889 domain-containing protein [Pseudomonadota bacterium]